MSKDQQKDIEQIKRDVHDIAIVVKVMAALVFIGLVCFAGMYLTAKK